MELSFTTWPGLIFFCLATLTIMRIAYRISSKQELQAGIKSSDKYFYTFLALILCCIAASLLMSVLLAEVQISIILWPIHGYMIATVIAVAVTYWIADARNEKFRGNPGDKFLYPFLVLLVMVTITFCTLPAARKAFEKSLFWQR
ncbi:hypothetical protein JNK13_09660 [bacterium]|nr:hypothetical protein [bacterium]